MELVCFFVGDGYDPLSGSFHPTNAHYLPGGGFDVSYSNSPPENELPQRARFTGGIVEIPLTTPWDITSGSGGSMDWENAKVGRTTYLQYHSDIDAYAAQQLMSAPALAAATDSGCTSGCHANVIDATSCNYYTVGGTSPSCITFKPDGTRFFTAHSTTLEKHLCGAGNHRHAFVGPFTDPFSAGTLGTSYRLEEWILDTPWDVESIKRTGQYSYQNTKTNLGQVSTIGTYADGSANGMGHVGHYRKMGRSLDLSTISTPEGYPIKVKGIKFDDNGERMWLITKVSSISEPHGTRYAAGGWPEGEIAVDPHPQFIPFTSNGTEKEGNKMWEFKLTVPWDIATAQWVQNFNLSETGGILEQRDILRMMRVLQLRVWPILHIQ